MGYSNPHKGPNYLSHYHKRWLGIFLPARHHDYPQMNHDHRDAAFSVIHDLMSRDPNIVVLNNDHGAFGLNVIRKEFPERAINVGVAEQNMMSLAAGLASCGKKVFVYGIIANLTRGWEQVKVGICIPNFPVTIIGTAAALSGGRDGPTHHGTEDVALMRVLPNMTIYNPADTVCTAACVRMAYKAGTPHYIRLDKEQLPHLYPPDYSFESGYGVFGGEAPAIIATGIETRRAVRQGKIVVDVFRLKPTPDLSAYLHGDFEVWDEHNPNGGLVSIVAEQMATFKRKTLPDKFLPSIVRETV